MPKPHAEHIWTVAYFASWILAAAGAFGLAFAVGWSAFGSGIDDDIALLGVPFGAVAGTFAARATRRHRGVHLLLGIGGLVAALSGVAGGLIMFAAAEAQSGQGPMAGLGEAIVGVLAFGVAAIGGLALVAGTTGWLATRGTRAEPLAS